MPNGGTPPPSMRPNIIDPLPAIMALVGTIQREKQMEQNMLALMENLAFKREAIGAGRREKAEVTGKKTAEQQRAALAQLRGSMYEKFAEWEKSGVKPSAVAVEDLRKMLQNAGEGAGLSPEQISQLNAEISTRYPTPSIVTGLEEEPTGEAEEAAVEEAIRTGRITRPEEKLRLRRGVTEKRTGEARELEESGWRNFLDGLFGRGVHERPLMRGPIPAIDIEDLGYFGPPSPTAPSTPDITALDLPVMLGAAQPQRRRRKIPEVTGLDILGY